MTFFANSGVRFPGQEGATTEAGAISLETAGRLWLLIAKLEKSKMFSDQDKKHSEEIANHFRDVSDRYWKIYENTPDDRERQLSGAELDLASVDQYFSRYRLGYEEFSDQISLKELYQDLAIRIRILADALESLQVKNDAQDLAYRIFLIMFQWETVSGTARYISVMNQRAVARK